MKVAVRYFTKGGNTQKLAEAAAKTAGVEALSVSRPLNEKTDIVFLANSLYAFDAADAAKAFLILNKNKIGLVVNMGTSASGKGTTSQLKKVCDEHKIQLYEKDFFCKGKFLLMNQGHPNEDDLKAVHSFVQSIINEKR